MTDYISVDISEFQPVVDDSYPHQWLAFRACDGSYVDHHAAANLAWAIKARAAGRIDNFTVYVVYRPGQNGAVQATLDALHVPTDCCLMVDVESWQGEIIGDHSPEINTLVSALVLRQSGVDSVWGYGNRYDLGSIWPHRGVPIVMASYGGVKPMDLNLIGWQYTDDHAYDVGLPTSTPPFGRCDHDVFYVSALAPSGGADHPLFGDDDVLSLIHDNNGPNGSQRWAVTNRIYCRMLGQDALAVMKADAVAHGWDVAAGHAVAHIEHYGKVLS